MSELTDSVIEGPKADHPLETPPNALEMILNWSNGLPDWQNDAVRRILQQRELSDQDVQEILAMLRATQGLISGQLQVQPKRLAKDDLPNQAGPGAKIVLEFLGDLKNVNALRPRQIIKFHPSGLTIVFGRNATGKSGYARVLKKACRARGDKKPILPDVFNEAPSSEPAQAMIGIHDGTGSVAVPWIDGEPSRVELGSIAVFDAHCARVYVDEANDVFYVPYGLDVFDKLSKLCEKLKGILQSEIATSNTDRKVLEELKGDTPVGRAIEGLTHESDVGVIEGLAAFSETDDQKLSEIGRRLTEIKVNDPKSKARQLRATRDRILRLVDSLKKMEDGLSATATEAIRTVQTEAEEAQKVAQIASQKSFEKEPVTGVASESWKALLWAAKEFSERHAYKGENFPVTKDGARCVLCFQELTPEAADRLRRFWDFIEGVAQKTYQLKNHEFQTRVSNLQNLQVDPLAADPGFHRELEDVDATVVQEVRDYVQSAQSAHKAILECISKKSWGSVPHAPAAPLEALRRLAQAQESRAVEFDRMAVPEEKEKLATEFKELDARKRLASQKAAVLSLLENLKRVKKIEACIAETVTTGISRKSTEFMESLVTNRLKEELKQELKGLDVDYMKLELNKTGRLGVTLHQHRLRSRTYGTTVGVSDVMSEGEQRAIAVASFLAELNISQDNCGVIFDDPVSSLDHQRREQVAARLVREAKRRQVIVFTHDMVFLSALQESALKNDVDHLIQTVWASRSAGTGNCDPNPPWAGQTVKERLRYLKETRLPNIKALSMDSAQREQYELEATAFLVKLRQTWEQAVEEVVFNGALKRFRDSIEPSKLGLAQFTHVEDQVIAEAMDRISAHLHDEADVHNQSPMPEPDWLEQELSVLGKFVDELNSAGRRDQIRNNRPWRKKLDK